MDNTQDIDTIRNIHISFMENWLDRPLSEKEILEVKKIVKSVPESDEPIIFLYLLSHKW